MREKGTTMLLDTLKKIIDCPSPSGYESKVMAVLETLVKPYCDEVFYDNLGNLIALRKGKKAGAKKLMLAAHADEIGMMVTFIDKKGLLRATNLGYVDWPAWAYTEVVFGNGLRGVIVPEDGVKGGDYKKEKFYIDIGCDSDEEAEKLVSVGDFCILQPKLTSLQGSRVAGHPIDDRAGCAMLVEAAMRAKECAEDTYFVFTVQEEVGCRGAKGAAFTIRPDYALAIDVTDTGDRIGASPMAVKMGAGIAIKLKDAMVICDVKLTSRLRSLAKEKEIPFQLEIMEHGGTDSSAIQVSGEGVAVGALSVPTRYIHSGMEMMDAKDGEAGVDLLVALLENGIEE